MCRSAAMFQGWGMCSTPSLRWPLAKCRKTSSPPSSTILSITSAPTVPTAPSPSRAWIGAIYHELLVAGRAAKLALKNLCVWVKTNAGMGTFYRSQHELIAVFKVGTAPHINNFELGQHGRYRTNVWTYPGVNGFGAGRDEALAMHPTVKPVALVADAIKDCSRRNGLILDPFLGSGTTVIAAELTGRRLPGLSSIRVTSTLSFVAGSK